MLFKDKVEQNIDDSYEIIESLLKGHHRISISARPIAEPAEKTSKPVVFRLSFLPSCPPLLRSLFPFAAANSRPRIDVVTQPGAPTTLLGEYHSDTKPSSSTKVIAFGRLTSSSRFQNKDGKPNFAHILFKNNPNSTSFCLVRELGSSCSATLLSSSCIEQCPRKVPVHHCLADSSVAAVVDDNIVVLAILSPSSMTAEHLDTLPSLVSEDTLLACRVLWGRVLKSILYF